MVAPISSQATAVSASAQQSTGEAGGARRLSDSETARLRQLQETDRRVRAHEQAHVSAGQGVVSGGASFTYTRGPDGRNYATGGEVPIDIAKGRSPAETLQKAEAIERAALAPVDPSAQDRRVAARAARMAAEAAAEMQRTGQGEPAGVGFYRRMQNDAGGAEPSSVDAFA